MQAHFIGRTLLNGITLCKTLTDSINGMITVNEYISAAKYAIERYQDMFYLVQLNPPNQIIPLTVTPLCGVVPY